MMSNLKQPVVDHQGRTIKRQDGSPVTVQDLIDTLCDVLDVTEDHDLQNMLGGSEAECAKVAATRRAVKPLWTVLYRRLAEAAHG